MIEKIILKSFTLKSIFCISVVLFCACSNKENKIKELLAVQLKNCDKVIIEAYQNRDTFSTFTQDKSTIITFKELMNGRQDKKLSCTPKGRLIFLYKDSVLLSASTASNCTQYVFNKTTYQTRMTLKAGLLIEEVIERLIKERKNENIRN